MENPNKSIGSEEIGLETQNLPTKKTPRLGGLIGEPNEKLKELTTALPKCFQKMG